MNRLQIACFSFIRWCFFASWILFCNSSSGRWNSNTNEFFFYLQCIVVNIFADFQSFNNPILQFSGEIVPWFSRFSRYHFLFLCGKTVSTSNYLRWSWNCILQYYACIFSLDSIEKFSEHLFLHLQGTNCAGGTAGISSPFVDLYDFPSSFYFLLIFLSFDFLLFFFCFFGFFDVSCASASFNPFHCM